MRKHIKDKAPVQPSVEELFVNSVRMTFELADILGLTFEQFLDTMKQAWKIDKERIEKESLEKR